MDHTVLPMKLIFLSIKIICILKPSPFLKSFVQTMYSSSVLISILYTTHKPEQTERMVPTIKWTKYFYFKSWNASKLNQWFKSWIWIWIWVWLNCWFHVQYKIRGSTIEHVLHFKCHRKYYKENTDLDIFCDTCLQWEFHYSIFKAPALEYIFYNTWSSDIFLGTSSSSFYYLNNQTCHKFLVNT